MLSDYTYFHISKNITSYTFFKIVDGVQCNLNVVITKFYLLLADQHFAGEGVEIT